MKITKLVSASIALGVSCTASAQEALPLPRASVDPAIEFPNPKRATRRQGAFVPPRNIAMVSDGMTKAQLYTLLDVPHFTEGFDVKRWNYIFNFYTGRASEYRSCQYQIRFDRRGRVAGRWWRDQECADLFERLLTPPAQPLPPTASAPRPVPVERAAKSYEFNFDFNSTEILPEGRSVLASVIAELSRGQYSRAVVNGFTDTMGSTDYNDALAARRAATVAAELARMLPPGAGIDADDVYARGGRDLEVATEDEVREVRNRRVRIELFAR